MMTSSLGATAVATAVLTIVLAPAVSAQGPEAGAGDTASGNVVYSQFGCGACHGPEGRGAPAGPSIATGALAPAEFIAYVRDPTGTMPAYTTQAVSDQLLTDLVAYLEPAVASPGPVGRVDRGTTAYNDAGCYECHSNEGQGATQGPRIGPDPVTFPRFSWYVRYPIGNMPPYTDTVLSDQDLADIHAFLQARPQPPNVDDIPLLAP